MPLCLLHPAKSDPPMLLQQLNWVASRRLKYSIGFNLTDDICAAILALPDEAWQVAYDACRVIRKMYWAANSL
jgi:hypothetical protein